MVQARIGQNYGTGPERAVSGHRTGKPAKSLYPKEKALKQAAITAYLRALRSAVRFSKGGTAEYGSILYA